MINISKPIGFTKDQYAQQIKLQLGSSIVSVEVEDQIPEIVDLAFLELKNYITDIDTMTLPYAKKIDLSGKNVANVIYIMRSRSVVGQNGLNMMYVYSRHRHIGSYSISDYINSMVAQQNKNMIATDLDFHFDKREQQLYVFAHHMHPSSITIAYTKDYQNTEEIIEPFWQSLLRRLALALTKETLGRIRGKYSLSTATYNLDSNQLLNEAQAELAEIREYLNSNSDMLLPID